MYKIYVSNLRKPTDGNVKAYADVTIGNAITLRGIKLINGKNSDFVAMPSVKGKDKDGQDKYFDKFYAKSDEVRAVLLDTFQRAYDSEDGYAYSNGDYNPEFTVKVSPIQSEKNLNLKAWATLNVGDEWIVKNISVNETQKGFMVNFPAVKGKDKEGNDKYYDIVNPTVSKWQDKDGNEHTKDYRKIICGLIINEYKPSLNEQINNAEKSKGSNDVGFNKGEPELDIN